MPLIGEFEAAAREVDPAREPDQFKLCGELFTVSDRDLTIPMGRFAQIARGGMQAEEMAGLAAMVDLIEAVVVEEDRERLLNVAGRNGVDVDTLLAIVTAIVQTVAGRPTVRPSDSSDGPSTTGVSLRASSPFGAVPPIQLDPRIQGLRPVEQAALSLVG